MRTRGRPEKPRTRGLISKGRDNDIIGIINRNHHKPNIKRYFESVLIGKFAITAQPKHIAEVDINAVGKKSGVFANDQRLTGKSTRPIMIKAIPNTIRFRVKRILGIAFTAVGIFRRRVIFHLQPWNDFSSKNHSP